MVSFTLSQDANNYLTIAVVGKAYPQAWDTWHGNRIRIRVEYAFQVSSILLPAVAAGRLW